MSITWKGARSEAGAVRELEELEEAEDLFKVLGPLSSLDVSHTSTCPS
jgi:hypothetical protein